MQFAKKMKKGEKLVNHFTIKHPDHGAARLNKQLNEVIMRSEEEIKAKISELWGSCQRWLDKKHEACLEDSDTPPWQISSIAQMLWRERARLEMLEWVLDNSQK